MCLHTYVFIDMMTISSMNIKLQKMSHVMYYKTAHESSEHSLVYILIISPVLFQTVCMKFTTKKKYNFYIILMVCCI